MTKLLICLYSPGQGLTASSCPESLGGFLAELALREHGGLFQENDFGNRVTAVGSMRSGGPS